MKVCIVGWYGTETIGDRGILAGIFDMLGESYGNFEVRLGSLFPFFTRRTFAEDHEFYKALVPAHFIGEIFESKKIEQLNSAIDWSDIVLIGGGPLMHINDLFMLEYALKRANKRGKKSLVFGCGVGPLFKRRHLPALWGILKYADQVILRDQASLDYLKKLSESKTRKYAHKISVAIDPSVQALLKFKKAAHIKEHQTPYLAVNLRSFPEEYAKTSIAQQVNKSLATFLKKIIENHSDKEIRLIPMHYFHIGNDDRAFMNQLRFAEGIDGVKIQNEPLNLFQTMLEFQQAEACFGMRFHSVVFQTILNGNNYILDYTEPGVGKISGFLKMIDEHGFYSQRYLNLQEDQISEKVVSQDLKTAFEPNLHMLEERLMLLKNALVDAK